MFITNSQNQDYATAITSYVVRNGSNTADT